MRREIPAGLLAVAVAVSAVAGCRSSEEKTRRNITPQADAVLRETCELLAGTGEYGFKTHVSWDERLDDGSLIRIMRSNVIGLHRPDKLLVLANAGGRVVRAWYDGSTFSVLDDERERYASVQAPPDIDGLATFLEKDLGMTLPLVDLIVSDPYARCTKRVLRGEYLGQDDVDAHTCHHLIFHQEFIDWELWIEVGDPPLPRKLVIHYFSEPGVPQYIAHMEEWNLEPDFADGDFTFRAPEGAVKVDLLDVLKRRRGD